MRLWDRLSGKNEAGRDRERAHGGCMNRFAVCVALPALLFCLHPARAEHAAIGTAVGNAEMPTADGGKAQVLQPAEVNVLVFFRPNQQRSLSALQTLAQCRKAFAGKPVRWTAVVSATVPTETALAMVRDTGFATPVLVDTGDALYARLGLALHPVTVIVDRNDKLAAFEPFRSVNYCSVVSAHLRHVLREISDEELRSALDPPRSAEGGTAQGARRYLALAEALLKSGSLDKALESARKSVERDPALAAGHALIGQILRAQQNCADAIPAFDAALALDAANPSARLGIDGCKSGRQ
jgi:tetratricopeptide (TPR) repeat protein